MERNSERSDATSIFDCGYNWGCTRIDSQDLSGLVRSARVCCPEDEEVFESTISVTGL